MSACSGKDAHPMDAVIAKAEALIEALPYIARF